MKEKDNQIVQTENDMNQQTGEPKKKKGLSKKIVLCALGVVVAIIIVLNIISNSTPVAKTEKLISKIGVVALDNEAAIIEAEESFNALTETEQQEVENAEVLTTARTQFDTAKKAFDAIEEIGEVSSLDSESKVTSARKLFDECDETLQEIITNKDTLLNAEKEITSLKAKELVNAISKLGKITLDSKTDIENAEKLYKALSEEGKKEVNNYDVLKNARENFDKLAKTEGAKKAKEAFAILDSEYDKVQNITWYEPSQRPYYADTRSYVLPYIGIQNGNAWMRLAYWYTGDDWIFWKSVTLMVDGKKYYYYAGPFGTERDNEYGNVWEYADIEASESDIEMLQAIANSKETIVRFQGDNYYYDLTISSSDKKAIQNVLTAYEYAEYLK